MPAVEMPASEIPARKNWHGQFRIAGPLDTRTRQPTAAWTLEPFGCRSIDILDAAGTKIGALVGTPIAAAQGQLVTGPLRLDLPAEAGARDAAIEHFLYGMGGSWACLLTTECLQRVYLDANGTLSLVYDPQARVAASTAGLLLSDDDYRGRFDGRLYAALDVAGEGWFPSGLTAHRGVKRLLCNHYLDLATFEPVRHWPKAKFTHAGDVAASAAKVADLVRRQAEALMARGKVVVALTGGNETRFLLAAYKPLIKDLTFVTVAAPATTRDVVIAKHLAERFGLRHRLCLLAEATPAEQAAWRYATGHCVTGPNMVSHPTIRPLLGEFDYFLGGLGGEIGRAFFWRQTDTQDTPLGAGELVPRFGMPIVPEVVAATEAWLAGVAGFDTLTRLDLAYMELRMSAWSAAQTYAQAFVDHEHPLIHRDIYTLMLDLPPEAKRGNLLIKSAIAQSWPELGAIPINRYGDFRDTLEVLAKVTDGKKVAKKLRKLFG